MAFPVEIITERNLYLKSKVIEELHGDIGSFPIPERDDFLLIGILIQIYNYIDLNLRGAVEVFHHIGILHEKYKRSYPDIHISKLSDAVRLSISQIEGEEDELIECIRYIDELELRRPFRNAFGHMAARRIPGEDALILIGKDNKDASRTTGVRLGRFEVHYAIVDLPDIRGLVIHLEKYQVWLAKKVMEWQFKYFPEELI